LREEALKLRSRTKAAVATIAEHQSIHTSTQPEPNRRKISRRRSEGQVLAEGKQINVQRQRQAQIMEIEVRNPQQPVETARKRVEAAKNSRINADLYHQREVRKFNYFVLDCQNALSAALGSS
jgi:hypothetical protein